MKVLLSWMKRVALIIGTWLSNYKQVMGFGVIIKDSIVSEVKTYIHSGCHINNSKLGSFTIIHKNTDLNSFNGAGYNKVGKNCSLSNVTLGTYSYIADGSKLNNITIGKFCSIGPNVQGGYGNHPTDFVSTSPYFYSKHALFNPFHIEREQIFQEYSPITIGHDVWVGANVYLRDGISIGNGAIVASGAVVTKDVADYAIVAGVPAKTIKFRHPPEFADALLDSKWWEKDFSWLQSNIGLFQEEVSPNIINKFS